MIFQVIDEYSFLIIQAFFNQFNQSMKVTLLDFSPIYSFILNQKLKYSFSKRIIC
jgi:hypothetical protein